MNDKVKAIFFAQYWNQAVLITDDTNIKRFVNEDTFWQKDTHLLLRSINDLTDEEKKVIAKFSYFGDSIPLSNVDDLFAYYLDRASVVSGKNWWVIQDYIRAIGIALPFTFLNDQNQPETYSVEKLVELGWLTI